MGRVALARCCHCLHRSVLARSGSCPPRPLPLPLQLTAAGPRLGGGGLGFPKLSHSAEVQKDLWDFGFLALLFVLQ